MSNQSSASQTNGPSALGRSAPLAKGEIDHRGTQLRRFALQVTLAEERERRRIAQGLHDDVGQLLAIAGLKLGRLAETGAHCDVAALASEIRSLVDRAIRKTRSLTFELSSPVLYEFGLVAATASLCEQLGKESGVSFRVKVEREPIALDQDLGILLFRAVRELCLNVVKHAQALRAEVRLHADEDQIQIIVADDGQGFDPSERAQRFGPDKGFGLFAIRESFDQIGGSFEIKSSPGKGTRAALIAPLR